MLKRFNRFIQKWLALLTPLSLIIGVLLGDFGASFLFLVPWLFAFMTFTGALGMDFKDFGMVAKHPKAILMSIVMLHVLLPFWGYMLSSLLFDDHLLIIGFTLAVAVPTGVTSVIWVAITRGNLPLALSIILLDTLLAPVILPIILVMVGGTAVNLDSGELITDLFWMIVLPTLLGILLNEMTRGKVKETVSPKLAPFSKLSILLIILINGSVIAPYLQTFSWNIVAILCLVLFITLSAYAFALVIGHFLFKDPSIATTVTYTVGMRNISIGVVIATAYFPPKVAMPVVFCMLFQQVIASFASSWMLRYQDHMEILKYNSLK
ncbi:bile acid:sodium symporter family protein [Salinicoccus sp. ID82-1]|uniref:Bile acid:sodium symporter family protein n=1 Tax=Salinicoccus cyprini TaxID=2493691 RepID=A0A558AQZ1_9STAP|nr:MULTISPECIES: bile acid:sodium symporter family protein [Salinicoccus]MCG1010271.1 bile acid:sodium symporter family protein [Salinicoccus sp. ID82-1]TVT26675.1 bile acid:sodium symporter family protein [Salinicoccus cyprini]